MRKIPEFVRKEVFPEAFSFADNNGYLTNSARENSVLMENMLDCPSIGGKLMEYMDRVDARIYIKDVILHKYSCMKRELSPEEIVCRACEGRVTSYHEMHRERGVYLVHSSDGRYILISSGTMLKWESGLRKILQYIATKPNLQNITSGLEKVLVLTTSGVTPRPGEEKLVRDTLKLIHVDAVLV